MNHAVISTPPGIGPAMPLKPDDAGIAAALWQDARRIDEALRGGQSPRRTRA